MTNSNKTSLLFLTFFFTLFHTIAQYKPEELPHPKTTDANNWITDPDHLLKSESKSKINAICQNLYNNKSVEVAVVMITDAGDIEPKQYAHELFNIWGVGAKESDMGLLILFAKNQRRIEFETGYGTETILSDAKCYDIQQDYMVSHFKNGDFDEGMIQGIGAIESHILKKETKVYTPSSSKKKSKNNYFLIAFLLYIGMQVLWLAIRLLQFSSIAKEKDPYDRYCKLEKIVPSVFAMFLAPFTMIALRAFFNKKLNEYRNTTRFSKKTGSPMRRLSEEEDDKYLEKGQVIEEQLVSIEYDVWATPDYQEIEVLTYPNDHTVYKKCPKCSYKTYKFVSDVVLVEPTSTKKGRGVKKYICKHCGHIKKLEYSIPKLYQTVSPGWSGSGGGWGGSSSGGFSGGGFSGGSFGGGSSGGGGAGSSW